MFIGLAILKAKFGAEDFSVTVIPAIAANSAGNVHEVHLNFSCVVAWATCEAVGVGCNNGRYGLRQWYVWVTTMVGMGYNSGR